MGKHLIILGGSIAGLSAAREIVRCGFSATIVRAAREINPAEHVLHSEFYNLPFPNHSRTVSGPQPTFYVIGGTLHPDAPSYVERDADQELLDRLKQGEFCYVLTAPIGHSSFQCPAGTRYPRTQEKIWPLASAKPAPGP